MSNYDPYDPQTPRRYTMNNRNNFSAQQPRFSSGTMHHTTGGVTPSRPMHPHTLFASQTSDDVSTLEGSQVSGGTFSVGNRSDAASNFAVTVFEDAPVRPDFRNTLRYAPDLHHCIKAKGEQWWNAHLNGLEDKTDPGRNWTERTQANNNEEGLRQVDSYVAANKAALYSEISSATACLKMWEDFETDPCGDLALARAHVEYSRLLTGQSGDFQHAILVSYTCVKHYVDRPDTLRALQEQGPRAVSTQFALTASNIDQLEKVQVCNLLKALGSVKFFKTPAYISFIDKLQHGCVRFLTDNFSRDTILYSKAYDLSSLQLLLKICSDKLPPNSKIGFFEPLEHNSKSYSDVTSTLEERFLNRENYINSGNTVPMICPLKAGTSKTNATPTQSNLKPPSSSAGNTTTASAFGGGSPMATEAKAGDQLDDEVKNWWKDHAKNSFMALYVNKLPAGGGTEEQKNELLKAYKATISMEAKKVAPKKYPNYPDEFYNLVQTFVLEDACEKYEDWKNLGSP